MTARIFTGTIQAAGGSYISTLKAGLASGAFSADFGAAAGINAPLTHNGGVGAVGSPAAFQAPNSISSAYTLLQWTGKAHFDPVNNDWWYCAGTTGDAPGSMTMIRYSVASNNFRHWQGQTFSSGLFTAGQAHNFEAATFDPTTRKIYRILGGATYFLRNIGVFDVDSKTATAQWNTTASPNIFEGLQAFPEANSLCVVYGSGFANIQRYSMTTGAQLSDWTMPNPGPSQSLTYLNGTMYVTGAATGTGHYWYAFNSAGTATRLADTPTSMISPQDGDSNSTVMAAIGNFIYAFKLSPGATGRGVYRYDPATNTWSGNLATNFPTMRTDASPGVGQRFTVGPISSEGVALVITQPTNGSEACGCFIWKP